MEELNGAGAMLANLEREQEGLAALGLTLRDDVTKVANFKGAKQQAKSSCQQGAVVVEQCHGAGKQAGKDSGKATLGSRAQRREGNAGRPRGTEQDGLVAIVVK